MEAFPFGGLSVKFAWDSIRQRGLRDRSPLLSQSKILIWHLFKAILLVDLVVKHSAMQLASRCVCCEDPGEESLFLSSFIVT